MEEGKETVVIVIETQIAADEDNKEEDLVEMAQRLQIALEKEELVIPGTKLVKIEWEKGDQKSVVKED